MLLIIHVMCYSIFFCALSSCCGLRLKSLKMSTLSVASWNVNGIRSLLKHDPQGNTLKRLINSNKLDILCLQETKLQDIHEAEIESVLKEKIGVRRILWSSSKARKGYSGTAILLFDKYYNDSHELLTEIGEKEGDLEGRTLTYNHERFIVVNVYTPNSGSALKRLDYRTNTWDVSFSNYINLLRIKYPIKPIFVVGDLNVAYESIDYFNSNKSSSKSQSGTTPQEQNSFKINLLTNSQLIDTYRDFHGPNSIKYSYFSPRKGDLGRLNKEGWRLDYILLNYPKLNDKISWKSKVIEIPYIMDDLSHPYSDHCPVGLQFTL